MHSISESKQILLQFKVQDHLHLKYRGAILIALNYELTGMKRFCFNIRNMLWFCPESHHLWLVINILGYTNHIGKEGVRINAIVLNILLVWSIAYIKYSIKGKIEQHLLSLLLAIYEPSVSELLEEER